jgi:hypothetical protein
MTAVPGTAQRMCKQPGGVGDRRELHVYHLNGPNARGGEREAMRATVLLADAAQVVGGKLYILGGGWSIVGPDPSPTAIAVKIEVPWHEADVAHHWELRLLDADGRPVVVDDGTFSRPVAIAESFEVTRPAGVPAGSPLDFHVAVNIGPLPLAPGQRYVWQLSIDGESDPDWEASFSTRQFASSSTN